MCCRRNRKTPAEKSAASFDHYSKSLALMVLGCLIDIGLAGAAVAKTTSGAHGPLAGHLVLTILDMFVLGALWTRTVKSFGLVEVHKGHFRPALTSTPTSTYILLTLSFLVWGACIALAVVALNNDESYLYSSDDSSNYYDRVKRLGRRYSPYEGVGDAIGSGPLIGCIVTSASMTTVCLEAMFQLHQSLKYARIADAAGPRVGNV